MTVFEREILRTLSYYDLFSHPLTANELYLFLSRNSLTRKEFRDQLNTLKETSQIRLRGGYYSLRARAQEVVHLRATKERRARRRWTIARCLTGLIKRFPFVRGVFISGDLAKNVASRESDIDFFIITAPHRLWITRTLLVLFKKIVLFNKKKYFCLNYFCTTDHLRCAERNYFTATEIAHLTPLFNFPLFLRYMNENNWIQTFFPNFRVGDNRSRFCVDRTSLLQHFVELPLGGRFGDWLDARLMRFMKRMWKQRYPFLSEEERDFRFRATPSESRAFGQEFGSIILERYGLKLKELGLEPVTPV